MMDASPGCKRLTAGAAAIDITPSGRQFLAGYPHVERWSEGVHDALWASALFITDGSTPLLFISCDLLYLDPAMVRRAQQRIAQEGGVSPGHILISATHTHSGPTVMRPLAAPPDSGWPDPDPAFLRQVEEGIVAAGVLAIRSARPSRIGTAYADAAGVGTNRHDPAGPSDLRVPLLLATEADGGAPIGLMAVCHMHPTVLHEDSLLISGDFPGLARQYLQRHVLRRDTPFVYHMGVAGNQSPRHVTRGNTFAEAQRLGELLGQAIERAIAGMTLREEAELKCDLAPVELPIRAFPPLDEALAQEEAARMTLGILRAAGAPRTEVRTAECDWFGAEHTVSLARQAARITAAAAARNPVDIQLLSVGGLHFIGWPGEVFIEFGLAVQVRHPRSAIITQAGGTLYGYLVTQEAIVKQRYEALNAAFESPASGERLVEATCQLLQACVSRLVACG